MEKIRGFLLRALGIEDVKKENEKLRELLAESVALQMKRIQITTGIKNEPDLRAYQDLAILRLTALKVPFIC